MSEDYAYVTPHGRVLDRSNILAIIRSPGYQLHCGARSEIKIRFLGKGEAVVRNKWKGEGSFEGQTFKDDNCVMVCAVRMENGK